MKLSKLFLSWFAGIADGEGCIYIAKQCRGKKTYFAPAFSVCMTHKRTMFKIAKMCKAKLYTHIPHYPNAKRYWTVRFWNQDGRKMLQQILPFLVTKYKQAKIMIQLCKIQTHSKRGHVHHSKLQERLYKEVKQLNV